ncbi:MAG: DotI/IcmL/TraM family protein [Alphaproteobacteria bacterium]|nr:DotI/IcmL/TraM family protein [Alphaproteobacteria bacterium]
MTESAVSASKAPPSAPRRGAPPEKTDACDESAASSEFNRLKKMIGIQSWVIGALALVLLLLLPFAKPIYVYYARKPNGRTLQMVGLTMPNMTNRAVISWTTTSITEIMTMGFGDIDVKLPKQRWRFTKGGWKAYLKAFVGQKIGETFKENQLVLTTVPSNTPVITGQGVNPDQVYEWVVQMPVIMTYMTNDNVTRRQRAFVTLHVVRVSAEDSPSGIAIKDWILGGTAQ